jgi:hypothetical protein
MFVRGVLDCGNAVAGFGPHDLFEIEGLDDPEALDELVNDLVDFSAADELREGNVVDFLYSAHAEDRGRHDH